MASSLNADSGVVSGSAGLKSTADSSGVLALQTNGTTAVTIDTSQNVGIGTTSPLSNSLSFVRGATTNASVEIAGNGNTPGSTSFSLIQAGDNVAYIYNRANGPIIFGTNNTERFRIGISGQWGLGGANYGTSGQVLTSAGSGAAPTWSTPAAGTAIGLVRAVAINCILP